MKHVSNKGYEPVKGPWKQRSGKMFKLACCDCGYVHQITLTNKGKNVKVRYEYDRSATRKNRKRG